MTKMHVALTVGALMLASGHAIAQDQQQPQATPSPLQRDSTPVLGAPSKQPFSKIFITPGVRAWGQQPSAPQVVEVQPFVEGQPRVVCGMMVVPAKPDLDPKMVLPQRPGPDVEYKLRAITPPVCRE